MLDFFLKMQHASLSWVRPMVQCYSLWSLVICFPERGRGAVWYINELFPIIMHTFNVSFIWCQFPHNQFLNRDFQGCFQKTTSQMDIICSLSACCIPLFSHLPLIFLFRSHTWKIKSSWFYALVAPAWYALSDKQLFWLLPAAFIRIFLLLF